MFFLKPKPKSDELLPPPPPFPNLELEETKKSDFFDETLDIGKNKEPLTEDEEYTGLVDSLDNKLRPKKQFDRQDRSIKKILRVKQKPILKVKPQSKEKKKILKKPIIKKEKISKLEEDFEFPKDLKDIGAVDMLKEFDIDDDKSDFDLDIGTGPEHELFQAKPKEILEAEEEIKSAIEKIKAKEKPSIFKRLFSKSKAKEFSAVQEPLDAKKTMPNISVDNVSPIQASIGNAREALMKFDLEAAKMHYFEAMKIYNKMQLDEQAKVYHDIRELYFERKSAEELKV